MFKVSKNMKYGYNVRGPLNYPEIRDLTLRVEKLGFDSVHVTDHLIGFDATQDKKEAYLESVMLLAALATETHIVKLGHVVLCNSFRNPAYIAKMISTLDNISNGRALMWLGAGWYLEEYKAYGYPFSTPKRRVDELEESLTIYKKLFTEDVTDFEGKFWKLERNRNYPKPIQKPYPQIVLGTRGKRMINIACREADGINIPYVLPPFKLEKVSTQISDIKENLKKFNRDPATFEISIFCTIILSKNQEDLEKIMKTHKIMKRNLPNMFIGTHEEVKEKIIQLENLGTDKMVITLGQSGLDDPLAVFSKEVM
ncbi:hypothetical protein LCGC14_1891920 [marine sediment metagenome]|uniref:Luciferase-like domain-containing protein n=1 Tax=marine sediment metagenome TaxID=412755 RepID=A0A0F9ID12_9ZZZZ